MSPGARTATRGLSLWLRAMSLVAPGAAGRFATRLWFTPFPFARARRAGIPDGARSVRFDVPGGPIEGYAIGDGPKLALLIHGWAGSSRQFRRIALRLADDGYRSVVVDLPGHGADAGALTDVYEIADALSAVGSELGEIDLVAAHSLGAMAAAVAMRGSLGAGRLVLLAPGLRPLHALEMFSAGLHLRPRLEAAIRQSMEERFGSDVWDRVPEEMLSLDVPAATLVVHDRDDVMIPISDSQRLSGRWNAELMETRGNGHNGVLRSREVIDRIARLARSEVPAFAPAPAAD